MHLRLRQVRGQFLLKWFLDRSVSAWTHSADSLGILWQTVNCDFVHHPQGTLTTTQEGIYQFCVSVSTAGEGSVLSYNGFWTGLPALGATVLTAWGGYGKNSEVGLSLKRVGPLPAVKVRKKVPRLHVA